jgi:hypothetical protein
MPIHKQGQQGLRKGNNIYDSSDGEEDRRVNFPKL